MSVYPPKMFMYWPLCMMVTVFLLPSQLSWKVFVFQPSKARFKRRATAVPNSTDRIKFDFSTTVAVLHGSSSTWSQTSCCRRAELNS